MHVQAREENGVVGYRLWTTERDCYCGPSMTEREVRLTMLYSRIKTALNEINSSLKHAAEHGTSVMDNRYWAKLTDPWEEELHHDDFPPPDTEEETLTQKEERLRMKAVLEKIIERYLSD